MPGDAVQPEPQSAQQQAGTAAPSSQPSPSQRALRAAAKKSRRREAGRRRAAQLHVSAGGLRVGSINTRGLTRVKAAELTQLVQRTNLDILGVVETWEGKCCAHTLPGYKFVGKQRTTGQGGGVGFYVSDAIVPLTRVHRATASPESMWLEVRSGRATVPPLCIGLAYVPPSQLTSAEAAANAFAQLQQDLNAFGSQGDTCLMGDLNCHIGSGLTETEQVGKWGEPDTRMGAAGRECRQFIERNHLFALNGRQQPSSGEPEYTWVTEVTRADGTHELRQGVLDYMCVSESLFSTGEARLHVEPVWCVANTDHCMIWSTVPHRLCKPRPAASAAAERRIPRVNLLTTASEEQEQHQENFRQAIASELSGYAAFVQQLDADVQAGSTTAMQAACTAKQQLIYRIHAATEASIGYRVMRCGGGPRGPAA